MKKLMFALVAAGAAAAMATDGIESSNTVGYQNREIGAFNLTLGTFINAAGGTGVLGDIKPNQAFISKGTLQTFTSAGKAGPLYVYINDPEMMEVFEAPEGWYPLSDDEMTDCKNSVSIPFSTGFLSKSTAAGSILTYAGEVKSTATEIPVGGFTLTGNCSPKDLTLGDFKPNAAFVSKGTLQTFTSAGKAGPLYVYINDPEMMEVFEAPEGWYLLSDDEMTDCKNSVAINAGDAFLTKSTAAGSTLEIPSATK